MNGLDRTLAALERAREILPERPSASLKLLARLRGLPAALNAERDALEAEALRGMGYFARAERLYARLLGLRPLRGDAPLFIETALGSAAGLRSVGKVAAARGRLAAAREAAGLAGIRVFGERIALEAALIDRAAGAYSKCLGRLRPMLRRALARRDWAGGAFLLWAAGGAERFRGRFETSERAFLRSERLAARAGDAIGRGYALFGLGGVTRIRGKLAASARWYALAARRFRGTDDLFAQAYAQCGLANALRQLGRLGEAERLYRASHALYSRLGDTVDLAYVDWGLGGVHLLRGELRPAERRLRAALAAFRAGGESRGEVLAGLSLARCLHAAGRTPEARRLHDQALGLARDHGITAHLEVFT